MRDFQVKKYPTISSGVGILPTPQYWIIYLLEFPETKPKAPTEIPAEPKQTQTQFVTLHLPSQFWYFEGYHRPAITHPDNVVYDIIGSLLSDGRTSRLYKSLVEQQLALAAQGSSGFPGDKYPNLRNCTAFAG